jgi:exosortase N
MKTASLSASWSRFGWPLGYSLAVCLLFAYAEQDNFSWSLSFSLGLAAAPFVFRLGSPALSYRYLWPTLAGLLLLVFMRSSTVFYFCCCGAILLGWEHTVGRRSGLALLLLVVMAPLVRHLSYVWSFPIRLQLSQWAAGVLQLAGLAVEAQGNIVLVDGQEFAVDPACMGLQMLITALLAAVFLMALTAHQTGRRLPLGHQVAGLAGMLLLAIFANFIRLLTLLVFRVLPDNPLHEGIGLLSLLVYALLPFYGWWRWWGRGSEVGPGPVLLQTFPARPSWHRYALHLGLLLALAGVGRQFRHPPVVATPAPLAEKRDGYQAEQTELGVLKLSSPTALVYIKPPVRAFQGGHDPRICWQGSGYDFTHIDTTTIAGQLVYRATLEKGSDHLFTAWWYDGGPHKTISEWAWRWETLWEQRPYRLINVTTASATSLQLEVERWLD